MCWPRRTWSPALVVYQMCVQFWHNSYSSVSRIARALQRVLAKTRQATNIQSAATYHKAGEITKAVLELSKALNNNSVCRTPAVVMLSPEVRGSGFRG